MRTCIAQLEGTSPYTQSRAYFQPKDDKETHEQYEERCWRDHLHVNDKGIVVLPPMSLKWSIEAACKFLDLKIPGRRGSAFHKRFSSGVMVLEPPQTNWKRDEVQCHWLMLNADGRRGSGSRVRRCFPKMDAWKAEATFHVLDDLITEEIFEKCLREAGSFVGIGQFRPEKGGYFGRFKVNKIQWS